MIAVGAAVQPLDIPSPVAMSGFAARTAPSRGQHDPLDARALALDQVVLITLDVCALEESTCAAIAQQVRPSAPEQVIVTATHTHSGPCSSPHRLTRCDARTERLLVDAAVAAGTAARAARRPCGVRYREARRVGVAKNRRHPEAAVDPPVQAVQFLAEPGSGREGAVVATLLTYPCHPVVLDATNLLLSADYVHPLRARIESEHPGSVALFATGCAGDLNTGHRAEHSFSLQGSTARSFDEAERVGTRIAEAALAGRPVPGGSSGSEVALISSAVTLPIARPGAEQIAADTAAWTQELGTAAPGRAALLGRWLEWAAAVPEGAEWTGRVSAFRAGGVIVLTLPGEPFLAVAERLRAQVAAEAGAPCLVLGYADGCPGYFPTAQEHRRGGYEVEDAHRYYGMPGPFAEGAAERLIDRATEVCRRLGR